MPKLRFSAYLNTTQLPTVPQVFGHYGLIPASDWGMLGNDQVGDCAIAGIDHIEMLWNAEAKKQVTFTTKDALNEYSAITGYIPGDPSTDQGTDIVTAAQYWQSTGIADNNGVVHKIASFLQVDTPDHAITAAYLFGACGLGIQLTDEAQAQFMNGQPWDVGTLSGDYHFVPLVGRDDKYLYVVTWGAVQAMTPAFFKQVCYESVAYLSDEMLTAGKSPDGFDLAQLQTDLEALG